MANEKFSNEQLATGKIVVTVICAFIAVFCLFQIISGDYDRGAGWLWAGLIICGAATVYALITGFKSNGVSKSDYYKNK